jgi:hypothetical protein
VNGTFYVKRGASAPNENIGSQTRDQEPVFVGAVGDRDVKHEPDALFRVPVDSGIDCRRESPVRKRQQVIPRERGPLDAQAHAPSWRRRISSMAALISADEYVGSPRARLARASSSMRLSCSLRGSEPPDTSQHWLVMKLAP